MLFPVRVDSKFDAFLHYPCLSFQNLIQAYFIPSSITCCVNSMEASYIPIAKARGYDTVDKIHALHAECDKTKLQNEVGCCELKSTHSMRSATSVLIFDFAPYGLKSTHSMRSATAILYRNIVFLHRLHLFFWTNCFVSKNIIVFSRVSLFLTGANLPVFSCLLPIRTILIP